MTIHIITSYEQCEITLMIIHFTPDYNQLFQPKSIIIAIQIIESRNMYIQLLMMALQLIKNSPEDSPIRQIYFAPEIYKYRSYFHLFLLLFDMISSAFFGLLTKNVYEEDIEVFFNCCLAATWSTLGYCRRSRLTNPILITTTEIYLT